MCSDCEVYGLKRNGLTRSDYIIAHGVLHGTRVVQGS